MKPSPHPPLSNRTIAALVAVSVTLLWIAQPPLKFWPAALIGLVPMLLLAATPQQWSRRQYSIVWAGWAIFWLVSLQGLRHAHPVMYLCWIALAGYLAIYPTLFLLLVRALLRRGTALVVAAPLAWTTTELIRNYLLTGISAAMLGHTMADVPIAIQIADLFGSYGVGFVLVVVNVAVTTLYAWIRKDQTIRAGLPTAIVTAILLIAWLGYGYVRLQEPLGNSLGTFALVQRDEVVEYGQSAEREIEIFRNYARQSAEAVAASTTPVDAVIWPESMFTGSSPWMIANKDTVVPAEASMSAAEFHQAVDGQREYFLQRAAHVQEAIVSSATQAATPHLVVGCGVIRYSDLPQVFSGVLHIDGEGRVNDWYGKTHLVMFGEYVPIAPYIPGLRSLIPPGLGLHTGAGAVRFMVGQTAIAANICIETAVERVTVNQLADLHSRGEMADLVVTVTNDGWFDHSSVIEHHLRCAQFVAVGTRRPILSAANGGPTAWIDSRGRVVERLAADENGSLIATPRADDRISLYLKIGDWPARIVAILTLCLVAIVVRRVGHASEEE